MEEILDLVDEFDNVIDSMSRTEVYEKKLSNFRVVNAFLKNSKGEVWIPLRTAHKRLFPLHLDVSIAGHVSSGESYLEGFSRELAEELNIDLVKVVYKEVGYFNPINHNVSAFMKVYEIQTEIPPDFNLDDFIEGSWMMPEKVIELLDAGVKGKGDLPKLLNLLYLY
ncbi:MAG: NUDIX domain-containing protein [bacterium]